MYGLRRFVMSKQLFTVLFTVSILSAQSPAFADPADLSDVMDIQQVEENERKKPTEEKEKSAPKKDESSKQNSAWSDLKDKNVSQNIQVEILESKDDVDDQ
jgi:hypothetical protein